MKGSPVLPLVLPLVLLGTLAAAQPVDPRSVEVEPDDGVVPGEQHRHGQADVAEAGDRDLGGHAVSLPQVGTLFPVRPPGSDIASEQGPEHSEE